MRLQLGSVRDNVRTTGPAGRAGGRGLSGVGEEEAETRMFKSVAVVANIAVNTFDVFGDRCSVISVRCHEWILPPQCPRTRGERILAANLFPQEGKD